MGMHVPRWAFVAGFLFLLGMPVAEAQEHCAPIVTKQLNRLGIEMTGVDEIIYANKVVGDPDSRIVGVDAWVGLRTCNGYLVVEMTLGCRIVQTYTRKECRVQGVHHSC